MKTADREPRLDAQAAALRGPAVRNAIAYWLEDDLGNRITKLYASSDKPLMFAGRAFENLGSLDGWTVARRDTDGVRHVVAAGVDLEVLATPFMPERTPAEAMAAERFNRARRSLGFRRADPITDERVY
jgi:hypothetical protein